MKDLNRVTTLGDSFSFFNYRGSTIFWLPISAEKIKLCIDYEKNGLGYILGDFFTTSSGHPGSKHQVTRRHFTEWLIYDLGNGL
jgi:hypothetical protein